MELLQFETTQFDWSCEYYLEHGKVIPEDGMKTLSSFDGIFLGAVGNPKLVHWDQITRNCRASY
jgi:tartrate dehydrogenase/decarboxylase / D-malate dehydrogenase